MDKPFYEYIDAGTMGDTPEKATPELFDWLLLLIEDITGESTTLRWRSTRAAAFRWLTSARHLELLPCDHYWAGAGVQPLTDLQQAIVYLELSKANLALGDDDLALGFARSCEATIAKAALDSSQNSPQMRSSAAGGAGRNRRFDTFKVALAELLVSRRPPGGWRSKAQAGRELSNDLLKLNSERVLSSQNIEKLIERWIRSEVPVAAAYRAASAAGG